MLNRTLEEIEAQLGGHYGTPDAIVRALIALVRDGERDRAIGAAVRGALAHAANDDGCTLLEVAERITAEYADESMDADVWAVFYEITAQLRVGQGEP